MSALIPYLANFRAWFQTASQYKVATLMGFVTQIWFGAIYVAVYQALYANHLLASMPVNLAETITYVWIQQGLFRLLPFRCDSDVANSIRSGTIVYDRIRPLDTYALWYARALAKRVGRVLPLFAMMILFAGLLLPTIGWQSVRIAAPTSLIATGLFLVSVMLGLAVSAAMAVLMDALAAAMLSPAGVNAIVTPLVVFLSGTVIPLPLLPAFAKYLAFLQPFASLVDIPIRIYLAKVPLATMPLLLLVQTFWLLVFVGLGRLVLEKTMARLEIQGG